MQTKSRKFGVTNRILRLRFDFEVSAFESLHENLHRRHRYRNKMPRTALEVTPVR